MEKLYCSECKRKTVVVLDPSAGDTICTECGLILEAFSIQETPEWRTFTDDSRDNDPIRVGAVSNPLLDDGTNLSTVINANTTGSSKQQLKDLFSSSLGPNWKSYNDPIDNHNKSLIKAFQTISNISDVLGLVATIKDRANEIYKKAMEDHKGRRNQDAYMAASVYIACRQEDKSRTVKEICSATNGVTKKELGRAKDFIVKQLGLVNLGQSMEIGIMGAVNAGDFLRRFCSHLGMTNQAMKAAQEAVKKISEELDIRRSPISVAAAVIYMITQLSEEKKLLRDISFATGGVAEGTIRNTYKDLYPHAKILIPTWFAKEEDIWRNLCRP